MNCTSIVRAVGSELQTSLYLCKSEQGREERKEGMLRFSVQLPPGLDNLRPALWQKPQRELVVARDSLSSSSSAPSTARSLHSSPYLPCQWWGQKAGLKETSVNPYDRYHVLRSLTAFSTFFMESGQQGLRKLLLSYLSQKRTPHTSLTPEQDRSTSSALVRACHCTCTVHHGVTKLLGLLCISGLSFAFTEPSPL